MLTTPNKIGVFFNMFCDGTSPFFQKGTPAVNLSHHAEKAAPGNPRGSIPTPESADRFNSDPC